MAVIEFRTLGTIDLRGPDGHALHSLLAQPKRIALLTYLCAARPLGFHRRDTLLGLFWPDSDQAHARTSLRNALHVLRHSLGESAIPSRGDEEVGVDPESLRCDVAVFEERITAKDPNGALELYHGDFLSGFFLEDVPTFERWLEGERAKHRAAAARAALDASARSDVGGDLAGSVTYARRAVELANTDERAVRRLVESLEKVGDRGGALNAYEDFARYVASEFGAEPSIETQSLAARLRAPVARPHHGEPRYASFPAEPPGSDQIEMPDARIAIQQPARTRRTAVAGALAIGVLGVVGVFLVAGEKRDPSDSSNRVSVEAFENRTGRRNLDFVGTAAGDQIAAALGSNNLGEIHRDANDRAGFLVTGSYHLENDSLRIRAEIVDVERHRIVSSIGPVSSPIRTPSPGVDRLSTEVVSAMMPLVSQRTAAIALQRGWVKPRPLPARGEITRGLGLFLAGGPREEYIAARQHFYRAFSLDTTNLYPLFQAAFAHISLGEHEVLDSLVRFLGSSRDKLDDRNVLWVDLLAAGVRGDRATAAEASQQLLELSRGVVWEFQAGYHALSASRPRHTIEIMKGLDPDSGFLKGVWAYRGVMAEAYHIIGDHQNELKLAQRERLQHRRLLSTALYEVRALAALGRIDDLRRALTATESLPAQSGLIPSLPPLADLSAGSVMLEAALELRAHGYQSDSRRVLQNANRWFAARAQENPTGQPPLRGLARAYYIAGRWSDAMAVWQALHTTNPADVDYLGYTGVLAARLGRREDASRIDVLLRDWDRPYAMGRNTLWRARIAALRGDRQRAVDHLRRAFAEGHPFGIELHRDVDLEPLRGIREFGSLLNGSG